MIQLKSIIRKFTKRPNLRLLKPDYWIKNRLIRTYKNIIEEIEMDPKEHHQEQPEIVVPTGKKFYIS